MDSERREDSGNRTGALVVVLVAVAIVAALVMGLVAVAIVATSI
jgi:hypothetical protein